MVDGFAEPASEPGSGLDVITPPTRSRRLAPATTSWRFAPRPTVMIRSGSAAPAPAAMSPLCSYGRKWWLQRAPAMTTKRVRGSITDDLRAQSSSVRPGSRAARPLLRARSVLCARATTDQRTSCQGEPTVHHVEPFPLPPSSHRCRSAFQGASAGTSNRNCRVALRRALIHVAFAGTQPAPTARHREKRY